MTTLENSVSFEQGPSMRAALQRINNTEKPYCATAVGRHLAVVIGIDDYEHVRKLKTAVNDATSIGNLLHSQHGYDQVFRLVEHVTREQLVELFTQTLPQQVQKQDRLLIYFAGHGIAFDGEDGPQGYLIPSNGRSDDRNSFLAMADLHDWLNALPCRHLLIVLDCCFAGAFTWYGRRQLSVVPDVIYQEHYDRFTREPAWQILTSAAYNQEALDVFSGRLALGQESNLHSPFAFAFLRALDEHGRSDLIPKNQGDGIITATELYLYLRDFVEEDITELSGHYQTPEFWPFSREKHGKGEYIFFVPGREVSHLTAAPPLDRQQNPYRGLEPYNEEHADIFFGRTKLIQQLADQVVAQPLTVVVGASGTGKSSLVKAGLIPYLRRQEGWHVLPVIRPSLTSIDELNHQINRWQANLNISTVASSQMDDTDMEKEFTEQQPVPISSMSNIEHQACEWTKLHPNQHLLVVIDQFEELITRCNDEQERSQFLLLVAKLLHDHGQGIHVVITLRTDFESQFSQSLLAADWKRFVVAPMTQDELRNVIEGPATKRVLFFDPPELADTMINEVIQTPGALPLLSFTLSELYLQYLKRRDLAFKAGDLVERSLTGQDYNALGGIIGALRTRADLFWEALTPAYRATMQRVMLRMIAFEGGELTSRHVPLQELDYPDTMETAQVNAILRQLEEGRFIVRNSAKSVEGIEEPYVELAHDALIREWPHLADWHRAAEIVLPLQTHRRLTQAAMDRAKATDLTIQQGLLWNNDPRLPLIRHVLETDGKSMTPQQHWLPQAIMETFQWLWPSRTVQRGSNRLNRLETEFVQESVARYAQMTRRRHLLFTVAVIVLTLLISIAAWQWSQTIQQRNLALINRSRRLATIANQQLTEDPMASIHLGIAGLPTLQKPITGIQRNLTQYRWGRAFLDVYLHTRPYTPEAELALTQALQVNQEVSYLTSPLGQIAIEGSDWSADHMLATYDAEGNVQIWQGDIQLYEHQFPGLIKCIAWQPGSSHHLAICSGAEVWLWLMMTQQLTKVVSLQDTILGISWSPRGEQLAVWQQSELVILRITDSQQACHITDAGIIWGLNWSPSGRRFMVIPDDMTQTISLYDQACRNVGQLTNRHTRDADLSSGLVDGRLLDDERILLWDYAGLIELWSFDGQLLQKFYVPDDPQPVNAVAISPNANLLASLMDSGNAYIWRMTDGKRIAQLRGDTEGKLGHQAGIVVGQWRQDKYLATGDKNGVIWIWDIETQKPLTVLHGHTQRLLTLEWLADLQKLQSTGDDVTLRTWHIFDRVDTPICFGVQADGVPMCRTLAMSAIDYHQRIEFARWADNETVISSVADGTAHRLAITTTTDITISFQNQKIVWSPSGNRLLAYTAGDAGSGQIWTFDAPRWHQSVNLTATIMSAYWLESGLLIQEKSSAFWIGNSRIEHNHVEHTLALPYFQSGILNAAERSGRLAIAEDNGKVFVIDLTNGVPVSTMVHESADQFIELDWDTAGQRLLGITKFGKMYCWNPKSGELLWEPFIVDGFGEEIAFSPDQSLIAFITDKFLYIVDAQNGTQLWRNTFALPGLRGLQWQTANDDLRLLSWGEERVWLWRWHQTIDEAVPSAHLILTLHNTEQVYWAALNQAGTHIFTAGENGNLSIWKIWPNVDALLISAQKIGSHRQLSEIQQKVFLLD